MDCVELIEWSNTVKQGVPTGDVELKTSYPPF